MKVIEIHHTRGIPQDVAVRVVHSFLKWREVPGDEDMTKAVIGSTDPYPIVVERYENTFFLRKAGDRDFGKKRKE